MIKAKFVLILLVFVISTVSAQEDYLDAITQESCDCVQKIQKGLSENDRNLQFGICIINAASAYEEELLRDHDIDLQQIDTQGEELGQLIGFRMSVVCPDILLSAVEESVGDSNSNESEIVVEGTISKVSSEEFVVFTLKESDGTVGQYYWLTLVSSDTDLSSQYKKLRNQNVRIGYTLMELFDPGTSQYRNYRVISFVTLLNNNK